MATQWFDTKKYLLCNTTLTHSKVLFAGIKSNASCELRNSYTGWQHFRMHRQWGWRWTQVSPHGHRKPDKAQTKNPRQRMRSRVAWWAYKLCNAWWWMFHVPTNLSIPQWVELYSLHYNIGIKLLLIILIMITMIIKSIKSKRIISLINHKIKLW